MAHRVSSPQRINSDAIGGIADMPRSPVTHPGDANDPNADISSAQAGFAKCWGGI
jgi:hypothetical protein